MGSVLHYGIIAALAATTTPCTRRHVAVTCDADLLVIGNARQFRLAGCRFVSSLRPNLPDDGKTRRLLGV